MKQRVFKEAVREAITARRHAEEPENLRTAIEIRDNKGDGFTERDNQANVVTPGYVIKLDGK